jgi:ubiquitin thioesterase OTU1
VSATLLGRPVREYAEWIADARHWGGEIELSILAPLLATEIAVLHAQPGTLIVYGRDQGHAARVHVIYDGLHYDPVALTIDTGGAGDFGEAEDVTVAFADDANAEAMMRNLCTEFHEARKFTDTAGFTLRCGQCGTGLVGEKGAVEHCEKTGHTSFQEYVDYS